MPCKKKKKLGLFQHVCRNETGITITVYASYWIINNSSLPLIFATPLIRGESIAPGPGENQTELCITNSGTAVKDATPFIYSSQKLLIKWHFKTSTSLTIHRTEDSKKWSKSFSVDAIGTSGMVEIFGPSLVYALKVTVKLGENEFRRTKIITISSQFILANQMSQTVLWRQHVQSGILRTGETQPFYFSIAQPRLLTVRVDSRICQWYITYRHLVIFQV